jgi:cysteinyl-tRNA synthetase
MTLRFFILNSHYRSPTDFTEEALEAAGRGYERLTSTVSLIRRQLTGADSGQPADDGFLEVVRQHKERFLAAMSDDFNTPQALAVLFDFNRESNSLLNAEQPVSGATLEAIDGLYRELGSGILGIIPDELEGSTGAGFQDDLMQLIIDLRTEARARKDWGIADAIRDRLAEIGVLLEDRADETTWRLGR